MLDAFGVEHGEISKAAPKIPPRMRPGHFERGWTGETKHGGEVIRSTSTHTMADTLPGMSRANVMQRHNKTGLTRKPLGNTPWKPVKSPNKY